MGYQEFISMVLEESSRIACGFFGKATGTIKEGDNNQILTEADLAIGRAIIASIRSRYPGYNVVDEEVGVIDNSSRYTWVIDPIDGTSNFAVGVPTYGTIIGLLKDGKPIAGGVALPSFSEIYLAEKDQGTFCNGEKIKVSIEPRLLSSLVAYTIDGHQEKPDTTRDECDLLAEITLGVRNIRAAGSGAYDGMMVARGKYGAYLNRTSKIWDNVGLHILIEEAGGKYTDFFGRPMDYSQPLLRAEENYTMCMAPAGLHEKLQAIIWNR